MDGLDRFPESATLIVQDSDIQGGAATFRGTRILVHHIAALLAQGATEMELREDFPRLTQEMIALAPAYAHTNPAREEVVPRTPLNGA